MFKKAGFLALVLAVAGAVLPVTAFAQEGGYGGRFNDRQESRGHEREDGRRDAYRGNEYRGGWGDGGNYNGYRGNEWREEAREDAYRNQERYNRECREHREYDRYNQGPSIYFGYGR